MEALRKVDPAEIEFFSKLESLIGSPRTKARLPGATRRVCGVDAAYSGDEVTAAAVTLDGGKVVERSYYSGRFSFPYVSGLFFLHEGPFVVEAVRKLKNTPDLVCFDAHGMAHPSLKGLATICGMVLGIPSIGVAKKKLVGEVSDYRLEMKIVRYEGKNVGYATSSSRYWSPGFSVTMTELERLIVQQGNEIVGALKEAHIFARLATERNWRVAS